MSADESPGLGRAWMLFVDGRFVESSSGATRALGRGSVSVAGAEDVHLAVVAARRAAVRWRGTSPDVRGLALYRMAELLESRSGEIDGAAAAVARMLWYAGVCDKIDLLLGSCVPVAGPYLVTTAIEPCGVVGIVVSREASLDDLLAGIVPPLAAGNAVVAIAPDDPRAALLVAECAMTAALPAGSLNILCGDAAALAPALAGHGALDTLIAYGDDRSLLAASRTERAAHGRTVERASAQDDPLDAILRVTVTKTIRQTAGI